VELAVVGLLLVCEKSYVYFASDKSARNKYTSDLYTEKRIDLTKMSEAYPHFIADEWLYSLCAFGSCVVIFGELLEAHFLVHQKAFRF
jgi:hypothetical protein